MADKIFTEGLIIKAPHVNAPKFIVAKLSFKVDEFKKFLSENAKNGWVNADIKVGQSGKWYAELDTYERAKDVTEVKQEIKKKLGVNMGHPEDELENRFTSPDENGNVIDAESIPF